MYIERCVLCVVTGLVTVVWYMNTNDNPLFECTVSYNVFSTDSSHVNHELDIIINYLNKSKIYRKTLSCQSMTFLIYW